MGNIPNDPDEVDEYGACILLSFTNLFILEKKLFMLLFTKTKKTFWWEIRWFMKASSYFLFIQSLLGSRNPDKVAINIPQNRIIPKYKASKWRYSPFGITELFSTFFGVSPKAQRFHQQKQIVDHQYYPQVTVLDWDLIKTKNCQN